MLLNFGFIILCPDKNPGHLKFTVKSLNKNYPDSKYFAVVDSSIKLKELKELKTICEVYKAKTTFTSLINEGVKKSQFDWNIITLAGTWVKMNLDKKYSLFIENERDILYPIVDFKTKFEEASINGLCFNKLVMQEVGDLNDSIENFENSKFLWAMNADGCKYKFKAILGAKIL